MNERELESVTRLVVQAVRERLGKAEPAVVEVVAREVVAAMAGGASAVPAQASGGRGSYSPSPDAARGAAPARAPARPAASGSATSRPAEGGVTTPRGAVLPEATGNRSLEMCAGCLEQQRARESKRAVVTTTGRNCKGVVATISGEIAASGGDIQDVSQTIVSDYFTMIMVVDLGELTVPFSQFKERLLAAAGKLGIHAVVMHEDVARALQRV